MAAKTTKEKSKRLVLLDAHAILHRAYHALPDFSSAKGEPTGGLYGLAAMLIKIIHDLKPDYIVACYDLPGPTFRHEAYADYKVQRPKAEDALVSQMKRSRDVFEAFGVPCYEKAGFEADGLLGTIVLLLSKEVAGGDVEIIIASGDMDTLQLVDDKRVQVYTLKKGLNDTILYDEAAVVGRFGFPPKLLPDYKGLRGDPSDNIVGIRGIGDKTASILIQEFGSIEEIYTALKKNREQFLKKGIKERIITLLTEGEEEALFSKTLAQIRLDAPIDFSLPQERWEDALDLKKVERLFQELSFRTLFERAKNLVQPATIENKEKPMEKKTQKEPEAPLEKIEKAAIATWLLDSNITNPSKEDILQFAHADSIAEAEKFLLGELQKKNLEKVYADIEIPLIPILEAAHGRGIGVNVSYLKELSKKYHKKLEHFQKNIFKEAGMEFNINSPKQMGEGLFDKLALSTKGLRKTQGGARSTKESELLKLKGVHPVIDTILHYREIQKVLSTYIDNIPDMVDSMGRLHTTFVQTGTTTGRFSSINPNLQNIPAQGEMGKEIRRAFVAAKGYSLVSFDYSQIELRVLAVLSGDEDFIHIFQKGRDIHTVVAMEVFNVSEGEVTSDMRRKAKVINFGIIYGMGVTSLQRALGTSRAEAQVFYDNYFSEFPGVATYLQKIKKEAVARGYTETLFGRRRYVEGIRSRISYIQSAAERMAVNAPIQGTAADIIKMAMARANHMIEKEGSPEDVRLILQVHDELVYEIKKELVYTMTARIQKEMESIVKDPIPFTVDVAAGDTWGDMKKLKEQN